MTPEYSEQWKEAVMKAYPIPMPDGQACSFELWRTLRTAEDAQLSRMTYAMRVAFLRGRRIGFLDRLASGQLPSWILEIQLGCADLLRNSWEVEFDFRSDVALIGMQVLYPMPNASIEACERVLLGFLPRALRPLLKYAETYQLPRQRFEDCYEICRLCESDGLYRDPQRWLDIERNSEGPSKGGIENWPDTAVNILALIARSVLVPPEKVSPTSEEGLGWLAGLVNHLDTVYGPGLSMIPKDGIARAFLEALEAECPPPDWLWLE